MNVPNVWTAGDRLAIGKLNNPTGRTPGSQTTERIGFGGVLFSGNANAGHTGGVATNRGSRTVPANLMAVNGDRLEFMYTGLFAANGNTKSIDVKAFGVTLLSYSVAINGGVFLVKGSFQRTTSTDYVYEVALTTKNGAGTVTPYLSVSAGGGRDYTVSNTMLLTVNGAGTNDVILNNLMVHFWPGTNEGVG